MLIADAYPLAEADIQRIKKEIEADELSEEDPLMTRLVQVFLDQKEEGSLSVPRYALPEDGIEQNLIGIDKSLTASQIILLNEAFELFDRPVFEALKESLFGSDIWMFFFDDLGQASGMNYTGTGLIMIDRRDLFGNRYILASVLAHEAAHVLQGGVRNSDDRCQELLNMEIGNGKIAKDFSLWSADQVISGIKNRQLGAYHISLWILLRLGYQNLNNLEQAILTGRIGGTSVLLDCP